MYSILGVSGGHRSGRAATPAGAGRAATAGVVAMPGGWSFGVGVVSDRRRRSLERARSTIWGGTPPPKPPGSVIRPDRAPVP
ncbi:hypothetical protein [Streptosporangium sp. NPDC004631]